MTVELPEPVTELLQLGAGLRSTLPEIEKVASRLMSREYLGAVLDSIYDGPLSFGTLAMCHETSTHYKWMLGIDDDRRTKVWLHEFKSLDDGATRGAYAEVPHTHRYSFASAILRGGYREELWERQGDRVELTQSIERASGTTHLVEASWIHSLSEVQTGTVTLLVEAPQQSPSSLSWNRDGSFRAEHFTLESWRGRLVEKLT